MNRLVPVGLVDSGLDPDLAPKARAARRFVLDAEGHLHVDAAEDDAEGHGSRLAGIILDHAADAVLLNAQVFTDRLTATPAAIAAALDWLVEKDAALISMSFGLRQDRPVLARAVARAVDAGLALVAASPARGARVFPAAYPGVLRVTGDARCGAGELSALGTVQADFGACVRAAQGPAGTAPIAGASFAAAHVSGLLAQWLAAGGEAGAAHDYLQSIAKYRGPERRSRLGQSAPPSSPRAT